MGRGDFENEIHGFIISISLTSHIRIITLGLYCEIENKEEVTMNKRLLYLFSGMVMALVLFASPRGWAQPKTEIKGPIITRAFAVDKGNYG